MARYEHLPIYKAALDAAVHFENVVAGFSRYHKYTLGTELRNASRLVVEQVIRANSARERLPELIRLRDGLERVLVLMRLAKEVKAFKSFSGLPACGGAGGLGFQTERGVDQECGWRCAHNLVIPAQARIQGFRTPARAGVTNAGWQTPRRSKGA